jgi:hypothetical protein
VPSPPFEVNHRARFKGWNFDKRWKSNVPVWNGKTYDMPGDLPAVPKAGQRPIVAFVGGEHSISAVQFVENNSEIVGKFSKAGRFFLLFIRWHGVMIWVVLCVQVPTSLSVRTCPYAA